MRRREVVDTIMELASGQWGLVTTAQAEERGVSRLRLSRMVNSGLLERIEHGVYSVPSSAGDPWTHVRAAWIGIDPRRTAEERIAQARTSVVVSHETATELYGIGTLRASRIDLTVTERRQTRRTDVHLRLGTLTDDDVTLVDGLPTTTTTRTVVDLLRDRHDLDHVARVAADAMSRDATTLPSLERSLEPVARLYGVADGAQLAHRLLEQPS